MENLKQNKELIQDLLELSILKCRQEYSQHNIKMLISLHCEEKSIDITVDYSGAGNQEPWQQ